MLSLDVSLAALAAGVLAQRVMHASMRPMFYPLLPLCAWAVYTLDHLLDARKVGAGASTARHRFHHAHGRLLWAAFAVGAGACVVLGVGDLSRPGIVFGVVMAVLVVAHLLIVTLVGDATSPWLAKELGVAVIFTAGTWGLPMLRHGRLDDWPVLLIVQYLLLALVNLLEFALYEIDADVRDGHTSFVRAVGPANARRMIATLLACQVPLAAIMLLRHREAVPLLAEVSYAGIALTLAALLRWPGLFGGHERYRAFGDGVFVLPVIVWLAG